MKVRLSALASATAEKRGEKQIKTRPGARKTADPTAMKKIVGNSQFAAAARATAVEIERIKRSHSREVASTSGPKMKAMMELAQRIQEQKRYIKAYGEDHAVVERSKSSIKQLTDDIKKMPDDKLTVIDRAGLDKIGKLVGDLVEIHERAEKQRNLDYDNKYVSLMDEARSLERQSGSLPYGDEGKADLDARAAAKRREASQLKVPKNEAQLRIQKLVEKRTALAGELEQAERNYREEPYGAYGRQEKSKIDRTKRKIDELTREISIAERDKYKTSQASVLAALAAVRPGFGTGTIQTERVPSELKPVMKRAAAFFPKEWVDLSNDRFDGIRVSVSAPKAPNRANWKVWEKRITLRRSGGDVDAGTAAHEFAHTVEDSNAAMLAMQKEFYDHRTKGEPLVKLKKLKPNSGYKDHEVTKVDKWVNPYYGRWYDEQNYELLTMGVQNMFYDEYGMRERDPEMWRWTLGLLAAA
jgi:hypothetical protein